MSGPDVIIVGAGPCAVSAAFPLTEAGKKIVLVDAGDAMPETFAPRPDKLFQARTGETQAWRWLLGENGLSRDARVSPKLRIHETFESRAAYEQAQGLICDNFIANGRYGAGGMSRYWGAATPILTAQELQALGLPAEEMSLSYRRVMQRIGVSGDGQQHPGYEQALLPPLRLDAASEQLLARYRRNIPASRLQLSKPVQAVLSTDHNDRRACNYSGACLWGCRQQSIYDAAHDLKRLQSYPGFSFLPGHRVTRISRKESGYELAMCQTPGNQTISLSAPTVILAGGAITSTRLLLDLLGRYNQPVRLENTPAFAIACLDPRRLGAAIPKEFFAMSQLHMLLPLQDNDYAWGTLYNGYGLAASDLIADFGFTMGGARKIIRHLMPSLCIAFFYLAGRYSRNALELRKMGESQSLHIRGDVSDGFEMHYKKAVAGIKKELLKLGLIPLQTRAYPPGGDSHLGASLPMGQWLDAYGQLPTHPGLYVADTASLPAMPAKHPTLTAMANADRIARSIIIRQDQR